MIVLIALLVALLIAVASVFYFIADACELDLPSDDGYYGTEHDEYFNPYL